MNKTASPQVWEDKRAGQKPKQHADSYYYTQPATSRLRDGEQPIRQQPIVHRGVDLLRGQFPDAEFRPLRDRRGCFGYLLNSPALLAVIGVKSSRGGNWLSLNQKLFGIARDEGRRALLVLLPSERNPGEPWKLLEVDPHQALFCGRFNSYNGQEMCNFSWDATRPFRIANQSPSPNVERPASVQLRLTGV